MAEDWLYVGTHGRAHRADPVDAAFGIYRFCRAPGASGFQGLPVTRTPQPGWLAIHPNGRFLYAVNEIGNAEAGEDGSVSAFAIEPGSGELRLLNSQSTSALPCHCALAAGGQYLLVATFGGGAVHLFALGLDGSLAREADMQRQGGASVHPRRQLQAHAHQVAIDPANRFVLVPDLGTDTVWVYELDRTHGRLQLRPECCVRVSPGSGPRHLSFDERARFVYLINEISATVMVFGYDSGSGALRALQALDLLPEGFGGLRSGAALLLHPSGRFLYATTRSHGSSGEPPVRGLDSLVWFAIDAHSGLLSFRGRIPSGGELPRSLIFDARTGQLLIAHQASGTIVGFEVDPRAGTPRPSGEVLHTPVPVCLQLLAARA